MHWFLLLLALTPLSHAEDWIELRIPKEVPPSPSVRGVRANMTRDLMLYFLRGFLDSGAEMTFRPDPSSPRDEWVRLPRRHLPERWRDKFLAMKARETHAAVFKDLRDLFSAGAYNEARSVHHTFRLPESEADLEAELSFKRWHSTVIESSEVKGKTRVIYRGPEGTSPVMSIAQTLAGGDAAEERVRETEIILKREDGSGDWDYYAYDSAGKLSSRSAFLSHPSASPGREVTGLVPLACANCHYHPARRKFGRAPYSP